MVLERNEKEILKWEVKYLQDNHRKLFPLTLDTKERRQTLAAQPTISHEVQVSLRLGEISCQLRAKMYAYVLPQLFTSISNYKVRTRRRDVENLTTPEVEKVKSRQRRTKLRSKLKWNETYEEAMKQVQQNRNNDATPK